MTKLNATPGPWTIANVRTCPSISGAYASVTLLVDLFGNYRTDNQLESDAALIAEAGTVFHETGLTPRQLAEQRIALREALREITGAYERLLEAHGKPFEWGKLTSENARAALARATDTKE